MAFPKFKQYMPASRLTPGNMPVSLQTLNPPFEKQPLAVKLTTWSEYVVPPNSLEVISTSAVCSTSPGNSQAAKVIPLTVELLLNVKASLTAIPKLRTHPVSNPS